MLCATVTTRPTRRQASVSVLVTVSLVALLAFVALAVDGGLLLWDRRCVQAAADAAAMAAAIDLYSNYQSNGGYDSSGSAVKAAQDIAAANGYENTTQGPSKVDVNIPPLS